MDPGIIRVKVLTPLPGYEVGRVYPIRADKTGIPLERWWRRRLEDAKTDGCVEIVRPEKKRRRERRERRDGGSE